MNFSDHPDIMRLLPQLLGQRTMPVAEDHGMHELLQAKQLARETNKRRYQQSHGEHRAGFYGDLLRLARGINKITHMAHVPVKLTTHALLDDPGQQREIMDVLGALTAMSGAPLAQEGLRSGLHTVAGADNRRGAARHLSGDAASGAAQHLLPLLSFLAEGTGHR